MRGRSLSGRVRTACGPSASSGGCCGGLDAGFACTLGKNACSAENDERYKKHKFERSISCESSISHHVNHICSNLSNFSFLIGKVVSDIALADRIQQRHESVLLLQGWQHSRSDDQLSREVATELTEYDNDKLTVWNVGKASLEENTTISNEIECVCERHL